MMELIYCDSREDELEIKQLIVDAFPSSKLNNASDFIHSHRFEVETDVDDDVFYPFAIKNGFHMCCFGFQLTLYENPELTENWLKLAEARL